MAGPGPRVPQQDRCPDGLGQPHRAQLQASTQSRWIAREHPLLRSSTYFRHAHARAGREPKGCAGDPWPLPDHPHHGYVLPRHPQHAARSLRPPRRASPEIVALWTLLTLNSTHDALAKERYTSASHQRMEWRAPLLTLFKLSLDRARRSIGILLAGRYTRICLVL